MHQMSRTVLKNNSWTLPLQLQKRHPCDYEDYRDFQDKKDHHCMEADVEFEADAIGHEMSNQQSEKQSFSHKTQSWIAVAELVPTYNCPAPLFSTAQSLFRTTLDHGSLQLFQCWCAATYAAEIWANVPNMAVEIETNATGHEMSHQQWERSSSRKSWIPLGQLMTTYKFAASFLGSAQSVFGTNSDHGSW